MAQSRHPSRLARFLLFSLLLFVVLYGVAGFLVLPWWLERNLPEQLAERMGWQAEVEGVSVNPFILAVEAERLSAQDGDGESVLRFDRLMVDLNALQLVRGIIGFEAIRLEEPFVRLDLLESDGLNLMRDWQAHNPDSGQAAQSDPASAPPRFYFGQIDVQGGELLLRDFRAEQPAEFRITPLDLNLNDLATWSRDEDASDYSLQAAIGDESIEWQGQLSIAPLYSRGTISVTGVGFETLEHFLSPYLPYDLRAGQVSLSSEYELQAGDFLLLATRNGSLTFDDLALAVDEDSEAAQLNSGTLAVEQIEFDLGARELVLGPVTLEGLELSVARNESGVIDWLAPLTTDSAETPADDRDAGSARPLRWSVAGIELTEGRLRWQDRQPEQAADLALEQLSLSVGELSHYLEEPVNYRLQATLASGGQLALDGQLTPLPFTLEAAVSGSEVALAAFEPYLKEAANLNLVAGTLALDGNLDLDSQTTPLTGTFSGTAEVAGLGLRLPGMSDRLVAWQTLRLAPIEYNVHPARLEIGTVTLTQPQVNVVRNADGVHNLARVVPSTSAGGAADAQPADADDGTDPGFIFRIEQLLLEQGALAYTDRTTEPVFTTTFDRLSGTVTGISNIQPQQGQVNISGRVGEVASVKFSGTLGALGTDDTSQLKLELNDLSLPELAPYFGRYIGYSVDSGKLDLDMDYEIAGTRLDAQNLVVMDRLQLGQKVTSDQAIDVPVALGLALLRDRDGVIEVELPISGDLSDPQFSVSRLVMRAFGNVLVKAASSPFSMMGTIADLAGLSTEELGQVSFKPGSTQLADGEADKLAALADGLLDRPDLLLSVRGGVAPEADGLALLRQELTAGGTRALPDAEWQQARQAYLNGERSLSPEALNNLASARGVTVRRVLQETHEVPAKQLFLLEPSRAAEVNERGEVTVQFNLNVR
ncbi:DUF748 domain-containing protein [Marinobacter sp.]|uniref:DUF748 domain-containing protein n=2 Tax=Marinobacter sp. TaxID=50741 RepID=UPI0035C69492